MHLFKFFFSLFLLMPCFQFCSQAEPIPLEAYGQLELVQSADISPDGAHIAIIANVDGLARLMVFDANFKLVNGLNISKLKARSVSFYDNEHVILRVSETNRVYGYRGEFEFSAALAINIAKDAKPVQLLRDVRNLHPAQSGLGKIVGNGTKDNYVMMPAYIKASNTSNLGLVHVNLKTGRGRMFSAGLSNTIDWFVTDQGRPLVQEVYDNQRDRYTIRKFDGRSSETFYRRDDVKIPPISISGVLPDESGLVFVDVDSTEQGFDQLMQMDFEGEISGPIIASEGREIDIIYKDRNRKVLGVRFATMIPEYQFLDPALQVAVDRLQARFPGVSLYLDSWAEDRSKLLYRVFDASIGDAWLIQNVNTDEVEYLTTNRPDIPTDKLGAIYAIEYKARDGLTIPAILTLPAGQELQDSSRPLIVLPHGGPRSHDTMDFDWMAQFFSNRGYAVLQPNFRGSTGFGYAHMKAGEGEWGKKMQDDISDGVKEMIRAGYASKTDVCIIGASYGGYAALAGAVFTPELYRCVIAIAPVSDLNEMLREGKKRYGSNHWVVSAWESRMADGDARRERLRQVSPVNFADQVEAPVLLLHGDDDTVVDIRQSKLMERALKRADKSVKLVTLKGEDHWLSVQETRVELLREIEGFLAQHMPVN